MYALKQCRLHWLLGERDVAVPAKSVAHDLALPDQVLIVNHLRIVKVFLSIFPEDNETHHDIWQLLNMNVVDRLECAILSMANGYESLEAGAHNRFTGVPGLCAISKSPGFEKLVVLFLAVN